MYLFFDTETTGKYDFKAGPFAPHQPRICQLAVLVTDDIGRTIAQFQTLITPDNWNVDPEAEAVHGISQELCESAGMPAKVAIQVMRVLASKADSLIGHNVGFDIAMVRRELAYFELPDFTEDATIIDTMELATEVVRAPLSDKQVAAQERHKGSGWAPPGGWPKYKSPTLGECYQFFYGKPFDGAHDAMADVIATRNIFFNLKPEESE